MKKVILLIGLVIGFCLLSGMSLFKGEYYLSSFEGKVVDADTKEPLKDAVVLAVYYEETISPAGSGHYAVDAQETLTDSDGQFRIPSKTVKSKDIRGKLECNLIIFKVGYGFFPDHKLSKAVGEEYKGWPTPEKYIMYEIPKLKTREERDNNIHFSRPNVPNSLMKEFIKLLNQERVYLGYDPFTIEVKEN